MHKIAVKELAYFVCQSGDLTSEFFSNHDLEIGRKIHEYWQHKYNQDSKAEYYIKSEISYQGKDFLLHGFIDGVLDNDGDIIIEEIKSTTVDLDEITTEYHKEHMAQNKIYAYLYMINNNLYAIKTRLTYISVVDYEHKSFDSTFDLSTLENYVFSLLEQYMDWINLLDEASVNKEKTLAQIHFPFPNEREGQRTLMKCVYQALKNKEILYAIAPTGIGKTMATLFSGLKTIEKNDKLFYLTAKGSGKNAPLEAMRILKDQGLRIKTIDITAKKKACNMAQAVCNPDECPFALGYFDRLNVATKEIFEDYDLYDFDIIKDISNKHSICAFEFSLYLSYFCDVVIADYNYVFDPHAHLIRYMDDDTYKSKVLVDEAHNLVARSKDMYSSPLSTIDIRTIRKYLNGIKPSVRNDCNKVIQRMESYRDDIREGTIYIRDDQDIELKLLVKQLAAKVEHLLEENKKIKNKDIIYDAYFKLLDFNRIADIYDLEHRFLVKVINEEIEINLYCLDASRYILDTINSSLSGIVFFSATLYPIEYHANLLTKQEGKYIELDSPFPKENLDIIIHSNISTKYKDRDSSIDEIIESIESVIEVNSGNYIVFFPSYQYLNKVVSSIDSPNYEMIVQTNSLTEAQRNDIINSFKDNNKSHVGFFVMGGVFSEGIDYIGDMLNGVIIVGVGLPMICDENNLLKDYFNVKYQKGFEYAYSYPGMTKVIQAVGRVIRSENDRGIALLIDERFDYTGYRSMFPKHWTNVKTVKSNYSLKLEIKDFYKNKE